MKRRLSLAIAFRKSSTLDFGRTDGWNRSFSSKKIWKELITLRDKGVGILVTTHVMDEAELTDKVGLLLGGNIIAFDTPKKLKKYGVSEVMKSLFS